VDSLVSHLDRVVKADRLSKVDSLVNRLDRVDKADRLSKVDNRVNRQFKVVSSRCSILKRIARRLKPRFSQF
jgi:hypothetical protein